MKEAFILDYGCGNFSSLRGWLKRQNIASWLVSTPDELLSLGSSDMLIFPGVGHFSVASHSLHDLNLIEALDSLRGRVPILGICLGFQLMFEGSMESPADKGLGWFPGKCLHLPTASSPRIGWYNTSVFNNHAELCPQRHKFFNENFYSFYYNHTFYVDKPIANAPCLFGSDNIIAGVITDDLIAGFQFHPERSQRAGESLLRALILLWEDAT
ncbi:imidazole glycerol phosphate synthase subunit HisH [Synechococcus sp. AH-601-N10]|nr:imidazole glycerol phosphate synthase subunit HisH [Synechococcus sp. AH-601-N10]